jgi:hypothetical protein
VSIQRWGLADGGRIFAVYGGDGEYVTYADHLAAVKELQASFYSAYQQQKADHLAAVAAVRAEEQFKWGSDAATYGKQQYSEGVKAARDAVAPMEAVVLRIAATLVRHPSEDERHDALQRHWSAELKSALFKYRAAIDALEKP